MTKKFIFKPQIVDMCNRCPAIYKIQQEDGTWYRECRKTGKEIGYEEKWSIPEWCPLEDV